MTEWPKSVLEYERLTVADRTVEWNDKAEVAIRDLKKVCEKTEDALKRLREGERMARREEYWGNEGDADAIRRYTVRSVLDLDIGEQLESVHAVDDKLKWAEAEARKWRWLTYRAIESFMDEWFEQPDSEGWIADQLLQYNAWRGGRDV